MSLEGVLACLEHGDTSSVTSALTTLSETERQALGPKARSWLAQGNSTRISPTHLALAVVATAGGRRQAMTAVDNFFWPDDSFVEHAAALLVARNASWLPEFVDALLDGEGSVHWRMVRGLVRANAVPTPDHPQYYQGTVRGVSGYYTGDRRPLIDHLDADPELVGEHLLRMLATEGTGRLLTFHDNFAETTYEHLPHGQPFPAGTWRVTLLALSHEGRLDRGRLLDAVLAAPLRDWAAADLGWYVGLHDALEPTLDEIAERQATYTRLLTVEHGPSVKTAQRELLRLIPDDRFEPQGFLDASKATLCRTDKSSVATHLRLLATLLKTHPHLSIIDTVQIALDHPRADIRDQAAKLLEQCGVQPTARSPHPSFAPAPPEKRPPADPVRPVESADELADLLLGLFEHVEPLEMERAIDGLLRFAHDHPSTTELLLSRASAAQYYQDDPRAAARVLTFAWLTPRKRWRRRRRHEDWSIVFGTTLFPTVAADPHTHVGAIGRRLSGIAHAVRDGNHVSVALPTHADFTIDADELNRRLRDTSRWRPVSEIELAIALLRVAPQARSRVELPRTLKKSAALTALREAQPPRWAREVAPFQRHPWRPTHRAAVFRDTAGDERHVTAGILARTSPATTVAQESQYGEYEPCFDQTLGLGPTLLPHDHDVAAAHAHPYLLRDLRKDRACSVPVIDAIARAMTVNGGPSSSALVLALAAKDARGRIAAQDAILDLARYGVLDGKELGRQAALLLTDDMVVGQRVVGGLTECARASDAAVLPVLDALQEVVPVLPGRRDAGAFLELAADLAERTGRTIDLPAEFGVLASGRSSSMLAKAVRRLLLV